jgi:hypothetical protein
MYHDRAFILILLSWRRSSTAAGYYLAFALLTYPLIVPLKCFGRQIAFRHASSFLFNATNAGKHSSCDQNNGNAFFTYSVKGYGTVHNLLSLRKFVLSLFYCRVIAQTDFSEPKLLSASNYSSANVAVIIEILHMLCSISSSLLIHNLEFL